MLFEILHRLDSKADRLLMYPSKFRVNSRDTDTIESQLLRRARDEYNVKLKPIEVQRREGGSFDRELRSQLIIAERRMRAKCSNSNVGRKFYKAAGFQSDTI